MEEEVIIETAADSGILDLLMGTDLISAAIGAGALIVAMLVKKFVPADKIPLIKKFVKKTDEELNK